MSLCTCPLLYSFTLCGTVYWSIAGDFHMDWNERRWSSSTACSAEAERSFMEPAFPHPSNPISKHIGRRYSHSSRNSDYDDSPVVTETSLPWRRDSAAMKQYLANSTVTTPSILYNGKGQPLVGPKGLITRFRNFAHVQCPMSALCFF